jgi:hypothetical protein
VGQSPYLEESASSDSRVGFKFDFGCVLESSPPTDERGAVGTVAGWMDGWMDGGGGFGDDRLY